jgi:alpha-amylase/alpha-mannosidase (GH57 family)
LWSKGGRNIHVLFRDHYLSDLIGFVYSKMTAREAAHDFIGRIRAASEPLLKSGRDALAPIILDGENAWEYYDRNGRPFLRELYGLISEAKDLTAATVSEAIAAVPAAPMNHIFPGSWINANFDVWIGAEEDNKAWDLLLQARQTYEEMHAAVSEEARKLAWEELMIAEGSDWCWWYGPEHGSENRPEFDQLYRQHLANVWRALGVSPPEALSRPILKSEQRAFDQPPTAPLKPSIDGRVTSYFEWMGAGRYRPDTRSGAMHGKRLVAREVMYGSDGRSFFLRIDFEEQVKDCEVRIALRGRDGNPLQMRAVVVDGGRVDFPNAAGHPVAAADRIFEFALPLSDAGIGAGQRAAFQLSIWRDGLPLDAIPQQGWIEFSTADPSA